MSTLEIDFAHTPEDRRDPMSSETLEVLDIRLAGQRITSPGWSVEDAALELLRQVQTHRPKELR